MRSAAVATIAAVDVKMGGEAALFEALSQQDVVGIYILSSDGLIRYVSPRFVALFGFAQEEILGRSFLGFVAEEDRAAGLAAFSALRSGKSSSVQFELRLLRRNGEQYFALVQATTCTYMGEPASVGVILDVSDRKIAELEEQRAQRALARSNRALRTLSAANQAVTRVTTEEALLNAMCRVAVEVGGYRMAWIGIAEHDAERSVRVAAVAGAETGYLVGAGITWSDNERGWGPTGTAIRKGSVQLNRDVAANPHMGPWREEALKRGFMSSIALPLSDERGVFGALTMYAPEPDAFDAEEAALLAQVAGDLSFGIVALRTRAERESARLREANSLTTRYALLAENSRDIIVFIEEATLCIVGANEAAVRAFGYPRDELTRLSLQDIRAPEIRGTIRETFQHAERNHSLVESIAQRKDGTTFPIEIGVGKGVVDGQSIFIEVVRDISDRKQRDAALSLALEQAVKATELKSEFVASVSHEIRTPLNGVIGMSDLLLRTELDGDQREYARTVHDSSMALLKIINDILDFSKLEAGKMKLDLSEFAVAPLVEGVVELVSRSVKESDVTMMVYVAPNVPAVVRGDSGRLRQVLMNLVGNAAKFTSKGNIVVTVESGPNIKGQSLRFRVADTGIGIPAEARERLFKPFSQADGTSTRRHGGTGLGLAIAKAYVELMGGEIALESTVGLGTGVSFSLLLDRAQAESGTTETRELSDLRLLIVDKDPATRNMLGRYAGDWKIHHDAVENGKQALRALQEAAAAGKPFDCAIVADKSIDFDSCLFGKSVRSRPWIASTRLLLLSTTEEAERAESIRARGFADAVLIKPVTQSAVFDHLAMLMDGGVPIAIPKAAAIAEDLSLGHRLRVLLAEDNEVNRRVAQRQLALMGCDVVTTEDGRKAVEAVARETFDVVLMDSNMPVLGGLDATRKIREAESRNGGHVPIIAMTANASDAHRKRCIEAGMDDYVSKPVMIRALREALVRANGLRDRRRP